MMDSKTDPIAKFRQWFELAGQSEIEDPNAAALATVDSSGRPSVRMVLVKKFDACGFAFYTNLKSPKAIDLQHNAHAALCFYWPNIKRQVRLSGEVEPVTQEEADQYFSTRPRNSQIGAWASKQSQTLGGRFELEKRVAHFAMKFNIGEVPRPAHWSGFRLQPERIEFWSDRPFRLHERILFQRDSMQSSWRQCFLYP